MATRLKTICFPLPPLSSITDASVTNFTQVTLNIPESSLSFKKVWVECGATDIISATGGTIGEWRIGLRLAAVAYTTVTQLNDIVNSGENMAPHICADFTTHFTTNWSGSSMTCDVQIYLDQTTGTTFNFTNGWGLIWVTYEYDDTSATQVMNAWIPMTSAVGALPSSKGAAQDTVPNIDTFLGYGSISYKNIMMLMEGNESHGAGTTTFQVSVQLDATTTQVSSNFVGALASDRYVKAHFDLMSGGSPIFTTSATHSFYSWISTGAVTRMNHAAFTILIVFTFDATSANDGNISLILPQEIESPMGATTSSDYQRGLRELWIQEGATVAIQNSAFRWHWEQVGAIATAYFRCGTQSFVSITDTAAALCGGNCHQRTVHDNITLARGRNSLTCDCYNSDTTDKGWNLSGMWIINYKCAKPTAGWGASNHTVFWPISLYGTGAATADSTISATNPAIPEADYLINALGIKCDIMTSGTTAMYAYSIFVERLSGEGGIQWERVYASPTHDDPEVGLRQFWGMMRAYFKRWPTDPDTGRMDIETARRWRFLSSQATTCYFQILCCFTYHTIIKTVSGTISNSNAGTVNLYLHRSDNNTSQPGELVKSTSRSGNGAYSFDWFDNTENVYVSAYEDGTHLGRSANGLAT
jgi:hypothetical protein